MRRALLVFSLVSVAGCYGAPPDVEGTPCSAMVPCTSNYVCLEGGCVYSPGAPGGSVATTTTTSGNTATTGTGGHTSSSGAAGPSTNTTGNTVTAATFAASSAGTTGVFTGTAGTSGPSGSSGTTGAAFSTCQECSENSDCVSGYCNFSSGSFGYCDIFECGSNPAGCNPFACSPSGLGCSCVVSTTATTTSSTAGTSGTSGGVLPICASCSAGGQCISGVCNLAFGASGFCDTVVDCNDNPTACAPFGCSATGDCACGVVTDIGTATAIGMSAVATAGTTGGPTTGNTGTTTGGGLGYCQACTAASQCQSGCCDNATGMTCQATEGGFCDDPSQCTSSADCGGFACAPDGVCCDGIIIGSSTGTAGTFSTATAVSTAAATTGSSGTFGTSSSSGSTGNCTGPGIQDNANCGGANQVCASGESCGQFTTLFGSSFYGCACTTSNNGGADSCRTANNVLGGNGLVVCDSSTLTCRAPQDLELPFLDAPSYGQLCAPGYGEHPLPDGGNLCAQPCSTTSDCTASFTSCQAGVVYVWPTDGGDGNDQLYMSFCSYNVCGGPVELGPNPTNYYGPCNSVGTNDGTCQPIATNGQYIGLCFRNGSVNTTGACGGLLGPASSACVSGDLCIPEGEPVDACSPQQQTFCLPSCNADTDAGPSTPACPNFFGTQTTCQAFSGDPSGNLLQAGVCE